MLKLAVAREDVRHEALSMIKSGRSVQLRVLAAIKRDLDHAKLHADGALDTVREKFSCRACEKITQPPAPFYVTPLGFAGPSVRRGQTSCGSESEKLKRESHQGKSF